MGTRRSRAPVGDISGLTGQQIKDKFALDYIPDMVTDVVVPAETMMRAGTVAARKTVGGAGGGIQFQLMERISSEAFKNERKIDQ